MCAIGRDEHFIKEVAELRVRKLGKDGRIRVLN